MSDYPEKINKPSPMRNVAGIKGTMVTRVENREGPVQDEGEVDCGPGMAVERMGTVSGPADKAVNGSYLNQTKRQW